MYGQENRELDGYIDGTANVTVKWNGVEKAFQVLFQTHEKLDKDKIKRAISSIEFNFQSVENIIIYPVLFVQLALVGAGCEIVFHKNEQDANHEAKFHKVYFQIVRLLKTFENLTSEQPDGMKPPERFKYAPLKKYWKKHVPDSSISGTAHNILNENRRNQWLVQRCEEKFGVYDASTIDEKALEEFILKQMLVEGQSKRSIQNRMTGEWLVFRKRGEKFHLLTLASHQESDQRIFDRISWADLLD